MAGITNAKMDAQEKKWRAEDDARVLMQAGEIMQDKERHAAAMKVMESKRKGMEFVMSARDKIKAGFAKK